MSLVSSYKWMLLTFSFLSQLINSQTGQGCTNHNEPCEYPDQVRMDAIYHPFTNAFIGGCNCGCDFQSIYNPSSSSYCPLPRTINFDTCKCECPNALTDASKCPINLIYNHNTCQCECPNLGVPGQECRNKNSETIANSRVLSDCSCHCPPDTPSQYDCQQIWRVLNSQCECECPIAQCPYSNQILNKEMCSCSCSLQQCPHANQILDTQMCSCSCRACPQGEILLDELTCECGKKPEYCCHPIIDNFVPYFGRCWKITNEIGCVNEGRCKWDTNVCFNDKPVCIFRDDTCTENSECCSTVCKDDGLCR